MMKHFFKRSIGDLFAAGFSAAATSFGSRSRYPDRRRATLEYLIQRQAQPSEEAVTTSTDTRQKRR